MDLITGEDANQVI